MNKDKIRGEIIVEILLFPFQGQADMRQYFRPDGRSSKGQCTISKINFPLILSTFIEQKIFFQGTHFSIAKHDLAQGGLIVNDHLIVLKASPTLFSPKNKFFYLYQSQFQNQFRLFCGCEPQIRFNCILSECHAVALMVD